MPIQLQDEVQGDPNDAEAWRGDKGMVRIKQEWECGRCALVGEGQEASDLG
jgi:hypothetical protein